MTDISIETLDAMDTAAWQEAAPWGEFKSDLILTVHHTLTEPTCPTARVEFELKHGGKLNVCCHGNTIQEAIDAALSAALARLRAEREKVKRDE